MFGKHSSPSSRSEKLYCVFDHIAGDCYCFVTSPTDGLAVRKVLLTLQVPIRDCSVLCLGEYSRPSEGSRIELEQCQFEFNASPRVVSWETYKFPEDVSEALAPLNLDPTELAEIQKNREERLNG